MLAQVKLISESWDVGPNGYQVGGFPPGWAEWNGRFRDDMRAYVKGDDGTLPDFARNLLGSGDIFDRRGRRPWASVNFITAHDGFTLADLYAYNEKHNEANGEDNRDGHDDNRSWNCGVEGPTDDAEVLALRDRMRRFAMATLVVSQGVPMILMGDESGRSQHGNNNAYCQDNELAWMDWSPDAARGGVLRLRRRARCGSGASCRCSPARRWLRADPVGESGTAGSALAAPGRRADGRGGMGQRLAAGGEVALAAATGEGVLLLVQRRARGGDVRAAADRLGRPLAAAARQRRRSGSAPSSIPGRRARPSPSPGAACRPIPPDPR